MHFIDFIIESVITLSIGFGLFFLSLPIASVFSATYFIIVTTIRNKMSIKNVVQCILSAFKKARLMCEEDGIKLWIIVSPFNLIFSKLNGNSSVPKTIMVSASWIEKLSSKDSEWKVAFYHTIGHELAHKMKEPQAIYESNPKARFVNWTRECRADFYGIRFVEKHDLIQERIEVINAIKMKARTNTQGFTKDYSNSTHPTWRLRCDLIDDNNEFGAKAIVHISKNAEYDEADEISKMIELATIK